MWPSPRNPGCLFSSGFACDDCHAEEWLRRHRAPGITVSSPITGQRSTSTHPSSTLPAAPAQSCPGRRLRLVGCSPLHEAGFDVTDATFPLT
jgi:hypothetical protein